MYMHPSINTLTSQIQTFDITTAGTINNNIPDINIHTHY